MTEARAKIVYVAVTYARSGTEQILLDLTQRFVRDGYPVTVIIPDAPALDRMAAEATDRAASVRRVGALFSERRDPKRNFAHLYRIFRDEAPQIAHFHVPWAPASYESIAAAYAARVPYRLRTEQNPITEPLSLTQRTKMRVLDAMVQKLVFVSSENRRKHRLNGGRPMDKSVVIPNAIDAATITASMDGKQRAEVRQCLGLPLDATIAVMVAALGVRKGTIDFVRAARRAHALAPDLHFVLIGDGDARADAEALVRQYGLGERVHFLGRRPDVRAILPAFDIYVQPSLYEGMSIAMLEALAAGLPMVTTRVDGVADVLPGDHGALVVNIGDTVALGEAMAQLAASPSLRRDLAAVSQARVRTAFTTEAMYRRYQRLYAQMGALPA